MEELLKKLSTFNVVSATSNKVVLDNGMLVSYRIKTQKSSGAMIFTTTFVAEISICLNDADYHHTAWDEEENRLVVNWFNNMENQYTHEAYEKRHRDNETLLGLLL